MNSSELNASVECLADQAMRTTRAGDLRAGLGLARHALRLARTEGEAQTLYALNALGLVQGACGLFIESIASCIDAYALALKLRDLPAALHAAVTAAGAGTFILEAGDTTDALLARCTLESKRLKDDALLVRIDNTYGIYFLNSKRFDDGIAAYERALAVKNEPESRVWLYTPRYMVAGNLAYLHVQRALAADPAHHAGYVASARDRIETALRVAAEFKNVDAEARARFGLGVLLTHLGEFEGALASYERAIIFARQINHQPRQVDSLFEMGKAYLAMGQPAAAIEILDDAFAVADSIRPTMRIPMICGELAKAYEAADRQREAAHYRAKEAKEREQLDLESAHAMRELKSFAEKLDWAALAQR